MSRPLCRNCGKPIAKSIIWVEFAGTLGRQDICRTKEEVQRKFNETVVGVKMGTDSSGEPFVKFARVWDGVSYRNPHFCKDRCAMQFGYSVAEMKDRPIATEAYWQAMEKQKK